MEVGQKLFAVTDHFDIIKLAVDSISPIASDDSELHRITTVIDGQEIDEDSGLFFHYETYYKKMYLRDGVVDKGTVFTDEKCAIAVARKNIVEKISTKESELVRLKKKLAVLGEAYAQAG